MCVLAKRQAADSSIKSLSMQNAQFASFINRRSIKMLQLSFLFHKSFHLISAGIFFLALAFIKANVARTVYMQQTEAIKAIRSLKIHTDQRNTKTMSEPRSAYTAWAKTKNARNDNNNNSNENMKFIQYINDTIKSIRNKH